jgi:hypothetical protein
VTMWRGLIVPLVVALVAFVAAGWVHQSCIQQSRKEMLGMSLPLHRAIREAAEYSSTAAAGGRESLLVADQRLGLGELPRRAAALSLGGFRGFYAIYLWTTAEESKNLRIHDDLLDTYYRIANLQPDYPGTYSFHGWNLAWNLSVQWATAERRYEWIRHGINFLREGISRNPDALELYETMGRIYYWRISDSSNRADVAYMTERVIEEDGAHPLLMAYRWYRQARVVQDVTGQRHPQQSREILARQSCYAINSYAKHVTVALLDSLHEAVGMRFAGEVEEAALRVDETRRQMDEALAVWKTTVEEWDRQTRQYPTDTNSALFHRGAQRALSLMEALDQEVTAEIVRGQPEAFRAAVIRARHEPILVRSMHWADDHRPMGAIVQ